MSLVDRLRRFIVTQPLGAPLLAGALARLIAATAGLGFFARDDYFHVLEPALRWLDDPSFDWDRSNVPGAGIRSHLLPRLVWLALRAGRALGIDSPETTLALLHVLAGAYSLLAIPAAYRLARRVFDAEVGSLAAWLVALHFVLPYSGTRLLIESFAIPPLLLGLSYVPEGRGRWADLFLAGFWVGLACWFRYQTGAAGLGLLLVVLLAARPYGAARLLGATTSLAAGAALAIGVQGLFDLWTTGGFLRPLIANIAYNLDPPATLTRSAPWGVLFGWLVLALPPLTPYLAAPWVRAARQGVVLSVPWVCFVLLHVLVPHKEERFLLPVLPVFLVLVAAAWREVRAVPTRASRRLEGVALGLHLVALALAVTSSSQLGSRQAMAVLRRDPHVRAAVSLGPELLPFFLGRALPIAQMGKPDATRLSLALTELRGTDREPNRFLAFSVDADVALAMLGAEGYDCGDPEVFLGHWLDRLVYAANPAHNRRRSPILLWRCDLPALARR